MSPGSSDDSVGHVDVDVIVTVIDPVIVAVHVNVNATVEVIGFP